MNSMLYRVNYSRRFVDKIINIIQHEKTIFFISTDGKKGTTFSFKTKQTGPNI